MESNESLRGVRVERRGVGYAALGPHFYVWDEDPRVLLATACALAPTTAPSTPMRPRPQRSRAAGSRSRR